MMTMQEFCDTVGCKTSQVRLYCDRGLMNPQRTGKGVSNNRRLFDESDLMRMQEISIYTMLGMPLKDIKNIIESPNYDASKAIDHAIEAMHKRIEHLRNVELLARAAQTMGMDVYSMFGVLKGEQIDLLANAIKANPDYANAMVNLSKRTKPEREAFAERERALVLKFSELRYALARENYGEFAPEARELVKEYFEINSDIFPNSTPETLLGIASVYMGNGDASVKANQIGGEGTSEVMGTVFFLVWCTKTAETLCPAITALYKDIESGRESKANTENLKAAVRKSILGNYAASAIRTGYTSDDYLETVAKAFDVIKNLLADEEIRELAGLVDIEAPKEEAYEAALVALKSDEENQKTERSS